MGSDPHNVLSTDAPYSLGSDPDSRGCHHTLAYILAILSPEGTGKLLGALLPDSFEGTLELQRMRNVTLTHLEAFQYHFQSLNLSPSEEAKIIQNPPKFLSQTQALSTLPFSHKAQTTCSLCSLRG